MSSDRQVNDWSLTADEVVSLFREAGARLEGHFVFSSWRHAGKYLKREILTMPDSERQYERLCQALAANIAAMIESGVEIDFLTGPANGGVVLARAVQPLLYELGHKLELIPTIKLGDKLFGLDYDLKYLLKRRGVMVEDVVTTGDSCTGAMNPFALSGATIVSVHCFLNLLGRTEADLNVEHFKPLIDEELETFDVKNLGWRSCPMCVRREDINTDEGVGRGVEFVAKYGQPSTWSDSDTLL